MPLHVGDRVEDREGHRGTVRYVGPVATSKSADTEYAGLEWDAPGRGKGDGSVTTPDGAVVRYFSAPPGMASFLKTDLLPPGIDVLTALTERYEPAAAAATPSPTPDAAASGGVVQLVGEEKVRARQRLGRLASATLQGAPVARVGDAAALGAACPRLAELDLSRTLISSWTTVAELAAALPALSSLSLGGCKLAFLGDTHSEAFQRGCLARLRVLVLNGTRVKWNELQRLSRHVPSLEELHLVGCGISGTVEQPPTWHAGFRRMRQARCGESFVPGAMFPALKVLNVSGNPLSGWGDLHALAQLPALTRLLASGCGLTAAFADVGSAAVELGSSSSGAGDAASSGAVPSAASVRLPHSFPAVESLTLGGGTALSSAASVDALDSAFPRLTSLRLSHSDLAFGAGSEIDADAVARAAAASSQLTLPPPQPLGPAEARQLVIARLPRLASLNGSDIRPKERADAEKAYARRLGGAFAQAWAAATKAAGAGAGAAAAAAAAPVAPRITDVFGCKSAALPPEVYASPLAAAGAAAVDADRRGSTASDATAATGRSGFGAGDDLPAAFRRAGDGGVIRAQSAAVPVPYPHAPVPAFAVSCPVEWADRAAAGASHPTPASLHVGAPPLSSPPYVPALDPCGLGAGNPAAAGALQRAWPRYFIVAAEHDLHAVPAATADAGTGALASSVVTVSLRSIAGASCTMDPVAKRLPLSMTVGSLKQLVGRLFKAADLSAVQLSWQEAGSSYPLPLDDAMKPLSYYGITPPQQPVTAGDGDTTAAAAAAAAATPIGEVLMEEVDPVEVARKAAEAAAAEAARVAAQAAHGDALRRAADADHRRAAAAAAPPAAAAPQGAPGRS